MKILGKICVNCTMAAIGLLSLITLLTLVWVSLV